MDILAAVTSFEHLQETASASWVITHNLNRTPVVDVYIDDGGVQTRILPVVTFDDLDTVTIDFSEPQTGFATLI